MNYLVVECIGKQAIVLDETGCFLKVENQGYVLGQTVQEVKLVEDKPWFYQIGWKQSVSVLAACSVFVLAWLLPFVPVTPYAAVWLAINPEVRIELNDKHEVVDIVGVNVDGEALVASYDYQDKTLTHVLDELFERAYQAHYLVDGKRVVLSLDSDDETWMDETREALATFLTNYAWQVMVEQIQLQDYAHTWSQTIESLIPEVPEAEQEVEPQVEIKPQPEIEVPTSPLPEQNPETQPEPQVPPVLPPLPQIPDLDDDGDDSDYDDDDESDYDDQDDDLDDDSDYDD
ncbi:MAG: anti-sigma-I factor RsgI family protein [Erysipelotrichaceae bacterium]